MVWLLLVNYSPVDRPTPMGIQVAQTGICRPFKEKTKVITLEWGQSWKWGLDLEEIRDEYDQNPLYTCMKLLSENMFKNVHDHFNSWQSYVMIVQILALTSNDMNWACYIHCYTHLGDHIIAGLPGHSRVQATLSDWSAINTYILFFGIISLLKPDFLKGLLFLRISFRLAWTPGINRSSGLRPSE